LCAFLFAAGHPAITTSAPLHSDADSLCERDTDTSPAAVNRSRRDAVARAAAVFAGKVIALDRVRVRLEVKTVWKGNRDKELVLATGLPADLDVWVEDRYEFALGREYLVYAYYGAGALTTDACTRTMLLADASDEIRALDQIMRRWDAK